jgi:DNA-binding beta-propeller fold protein YncE
MVGAIIAILWFIRIKFISMIAHYCNQDTMNFLRYSWKTILFFFAFLFSTSCGNNGTISTAPRELFVCSLYHVSVFNAFASGDVSPLTVFGQTTEAGGLSGLGVDNAGKEIFVLKGNSVIVYDKTPSGDFVAVRTISGDSTALSAPVGIAVHSTREEIFVTNFTNNSITVYPRTAEGNVQPLRTISGDMTTLDSPRAIAIDTVHDEISVTNRGARITVFSVTADGNAAPIRTISFAEPAEFEGIALDTMHDETLVTRFTAVDRYHFITSIVVYPRTAAGAATPLRTISGDPSGLLGPMIGIAVDPKKNEIFISYSSSNSIAVYDRTATGSVDPMRVISGGNTGLKTPSDLAIGSL